MGKWQDSAKQSLDSRGYVAPEDRKYELKADDGRNLGTVSYRAYNAIQNNTLDKYKPENDDEKKVLDSFVSYTNEQARQKRINSTPVTKKYGIDPDISGQVASSETAKKVIKKRQIAKLFTAGARRGLYGFDKDIYSFVDMMGELMEKGLNSPVNKFIEKSFNKSNTPSYLIPKAIMKGITKALDSDVFENKMLGSLKAAYNKAAADTSEAINSFDSKAGRIAGEVVVNFCDNSVRQIPTIVLALLTGGTSAAGTAAVESTSSTWATEQITNLLENPQFWNSYIQQSGGSYLEAKESGATEKQAMIAANVSGFLNAVIEISGGIEKASVPENTQGFFRAFWNAAKEAAPEEALEEGLQDMVESTVNKLVYKRNAPIFSTSDEDAVYNPVRMSKNMAMGGLLGGIHGGGNAVVGKALSGRTNVYGEQAASVAAAETVAPQSTPTVNTAVSETAVKANVGSELDEIMNSEPIATFTPETASGDIKKLEDMLIAQGADDVSRKEIIDTAVEIEKSLGSTDKSIKSVFGNVSEITSTAIGKIQNQAGVSSSYWKLFGENLKTVLTGNAKENINFVTAYSNAYAKALKNSNPEKYNSVMLSSDGQDLSSELPKAIMQNELPMRLKNAGGYKLTANSIKSIINAAETGIKAVKAEIHDDNSSVEIQAVTEPKSITLTRMGDFYEAFGDEALELAEKLNLTPTYKTVNGAKTAMVGFPVSSLDRYKSILGGGYNISVSDAPSINMQGMPVSTENGTNAPSADNQYEIMDKLGLTYDEKRAILEYKSSGSYTLNEMLYNNRTLSNDQKAFIDNINKALEKFPIYNGVVYRNLVFDWKGQEAIDSFVAQHNQGEIIRYEAPISSSKTTDGYPLDGKLLVHMTIQSNSGRDISNIGIETEQEVLFASNTTFYVQAVQYDGKTANISLEERISNDLDKHTRTSETQDIRQNNKGITEHGKQSEREQFNESTAGSSDIVRGRRTETDSIPESQSDRPGRTDGTERIRDNGFNERETGINGQTERHTVREINDKCELYKTKHTKTGDDIWVVTIKDRLPAEDYNALKAKVKAVGGYYSNFTKTLDGKSSPGFLFKTEPTEKELSVFNDFFDETAVIDTPQAESSEAIPDNAGVESTAPEAENKPDLKIGDVIECDGKQWRVAQTGFNMSFENLDKSDKESAFSCIGGMDYFKATHDYKLVSDDTRTDITAESGKNVAETQTKAEEALKNEPESDIIKKNTDKDGVKNVHDGVLARESGNDTGVRESEPVSEVEEKQHVGTEDRKFGEDVAYENGTHLQSSETATSAAEQHGSGDSDNRIRKSNDSDGNSGTGIDGNDNVDVSESGGKSKDFVITKTVAEDIDKSAPSMADNIKAIETLHDIEKSGKAPTKTQQGLLAKFKGWGGLAGSFSGENRKKLQELMSESELKAAQSTVNDAYFTPTGIIDGIYKGLNHLGFEGGNILEPSMGIGNFFGRMPKAVKESSALFGVEIDSISGRIAQQLYPNANIEIAPFQDAAYKDGAFDLIIGNVPFGEVKYNYKGKKYLIHDYFFVKAMDKLNDGGILMFLTTKGTLDKLDSTTRTELSNRGKLLGAYRLPSDVFTKSAGASVVTDLIIMQKTHGSGGESFINLGTVYAGGGEFSVNEYFVNHPENIIGKLTSRKDWRSGKQILDVAATGNTVEQLVKAIRKLPKNLLSGVQTVGNVDVAENNAPLQVFGITENDTVEYIDTATGEVKQIKGKAAKTAKDYIGLKNAYQELIDATLCNYETSLIESKRKELNTVYDSFVKKHGTVEHNKKVLSADNDFYKISGLEVYDTKTKKTIKSEMFTKDTLGKRAPKKADNVIDALSISIGETGGVDVNRIASLTGISENEAIRQLDDRIVYTPDGIYELNEVYLSGNVREKYEAVKGKKGFEKNEKMLEAVIPADIPAKDITPQFGSPWIKPDYVADFLKETLHLYSKPVVNYDPTSGTWSVSGNIWGDNTLLTNKYGTKYMNAVKIAEKALNMRRIVVTDKNTKKMLVGETRAAQQKAEDIKSAFEEWCFKDADRRKDLVATFNRKFNSNRNMDFSELAKYLTLDGLTDTFELRDYQKRAVARTVFNGNTLLAHGVGTGKTAEMISSAMELKRMGIAKKNMMVVPNHKVADFRNDILKMYPAAKVAYLEKGANSAQRQRFYALVASNDFDIAVIPHSAFGMLDVSADTKRAFINNQIAELEEVLTAAQAEKGKIDGRFISTLENQKKRLGEKLKFVTESAKDNGNVFEELGVDSLFVDEAHNFKNLPFYSKLSRVAGVSINQPNNKTRASRAENMFMITDYLNRNGGRITFGTATPITNSMSEIYNMIRFLRPDILADAGLQSFDAWASMFGSIVNQAEVDPSGRNMRMKERFSKFKNVSQMIEQFRRMADILKTGDVIEELPKAERIDVYNEANSIQEEFLDIVDEMIDDIRINGQRADHNMLEVTTAGQMAAIDLRLVASYFDGKYSLDELNLPNNRASQVAQKVYKEYVDSNKTKGTQFIFCDKGVHDNPDAKYGFYVYGDLINKLVALGIPREEIAVAQEFKDKSDLSAKMNTGEIRVLIGSTAVMGEGMNAQNKAVALHHMTVPDRPSDIEQREGRIIRYGNENKNVRIYRYIQEKSYDSYQWQMQERKVAFINQALSGGTVSELEEMSDFQLSAREAKAIASGNPLLLEKIETEDKLSNLKFIRNKFNTDKLEMQDRLAVLSSRIAQKERAIANTAADAKALADNYKAEIETLKKEIDAEFPRAKELEELQAKLNDIDTRLGINVSEVDMSDVIVDDEAGNDDAENAQYSISESEELSNEQSGSDILSGNGERAVDESAGKQAKRVSSYKQKLEGKPATERKSTAKELTQKGYTEEVVSGNHKYTLIKDEGYNDDMRSIVSEAKAYGKEVGFFIGNAVRKFDGQRNFKIDGIKLSDNKILIRYDGTYSPQALLMHEIVHTEWDNPEMQKAKDIILSDLSESDKKEILQNGRYKDYMALYNGDKDAVWEEFIADIFADMNDYSEDYIDTAVDYWYNDKVIDRYNPSEYIKSIDAGGNAAVLDNIGFGNEYSLSGNSFDIPYNEKRQLDDYVLRKNYSSNKLKEVDCKEIGNNFYVWENNSKTDYNVVNMIEIDGNEDLINDLREVVKNGTHRLTKQLGSAYEGRGGNGRRSNSMLNAVYQRRKSANGNGGISSGQSESNTVGRSKESSGNKQTKYALNSYETDSESLTPERKKEIFEQWEKDHAGIEKPTKRQLWGERAEWVAHNVTRVFPNIPERGEKGTFFAEFRKDMIQWKNLPTTASFMVQDKLYKMTEGLTADEYKTFSELVYFLDLQEEAQIQKDRGYDEILLPNEITPKEVDEIVNILNDEATDKVQQALIKRQNIWDELKQQYIDSNSYIGFDTDGKFKRQNYYHHQVIDYMNSDKGGTGSREISIKAGRGWLKERQGSTKAINTDFLMVENKALLQMQYDVYIAETLGAIKRQYDIKPRLEKEAFEHNKKALNDIIKKEYTDENGNVNLDGNGDPNSETYRKQKWYNERILWGFSKLFNLAEQGELDEYGGEYKNVVAALQRHDLNVDGLYKYIGILANTELSDNATDSQEQAVQNARTVLKYTSQKNAWIKELLADDYQTWETLAKSMSDTHTIHQPRRGHYFYTKEVIDEDAFTKAYEDMILSLASGEVEFGNTDIKKLFEQYSDTVRLTGAAYEQWVLPKEIVTTMHEIANPKQVSGGRKAAQELMSAWKAWVTYLNPFRTVKYGTRNIGGDLDAVIAGNPKITLYSKRAAQEIYQAMKHKNYSDDFMEWVKRGGYTSMRYVSEMTPKMQEELFSYLKDKQGVHIYEIPKKIIKGYAHGVENAHNFREAILRYSAYLYFKDEINKNGGNVKDYVASNRYIVNGLNSTPDKAYQLSKDLLGAYDEVGKLGQTLRKFAVPFYSFSETNAKRYFRMLANAIISDGTIPKKAGRLLLKLLMANAMTLVIAAWNRLVMKDADDKLPPQTRDIPHITFGQIGDETVAFRQLGSFSELLEWVGLDDYKWTKEDLTAPVDKAWGMITPFVKMPVELASGLNFYPSLTQPRAIRDRWQYVANSLGVNDLYNVVTGKPTRGVTQSPFRGIGEMLKGSFVYSYDYKESAYYEILDIKREWQGGGSGSIYKPTPKSNALYYMKTAVRYKDKEAALKYLDKYFENGGTAKGIKQSIATLNPMYGFTGKDTVEQGNAFIASLSDDEKEKLKIAQDFYENDLMLPQEVTDRLGKKDITDEEAKNLLRNYINAKCK